MPRVITQSETTRIYDAFGLDLSTANKIGSAPFIFGNNNDVARLNFEGVEDEIGGEFHFPFRDRSNDLLDFSENNIKLNRMMIQNISSDENAVIGLRIDSNFDYLDSPYDEQFFNVLLPSYGTFQMGSVDPNIEFRFKMISGSLGKIIITGFF